MPTASCFGTPTIVGEALKPIWDLTTGMFAVTHKGKLASAFGSYGWSGEGVPHIMERLKQLKLRTVDGFRVRFKPSEVELDECPGVWTQLRPHAAGEPLSRSARAQAQGPLQNLRRCV